MKVGLARHSTTGLRKRQRGVAAVEFSIVFVVLFSVLYALATFGSILYIQQTVSRAAEEGARAVGLLTPAPTSGDARVKDAVYDTLANSLVVPSSANTDVASRRSWIVSKVVVSVVRSTPSSPGAYVNYVVTVSYPYSANRLLPSLPLLDTSTWMPDQLQSRSTAALKSS